MRTSTNSRLPAAMAVGLLAALPVSTRGCEEPCEPIATDLMVADEDVGGVTVWSDGTHLKVTYEVDQPRWQLKQTHLYVGSTPPTSSAAGQYPYHTENAFDDMARYDIPLVTLPGGPKGPHYIAAQATVATYRSGNEKALSELQQRLPDAVTTTSYGPSDGVLSTYALTFSEGTELGGTWLGWSADVDRAAEDVRPGQVNLYSSYGEDLSSLRLFRYPEALDKANWVLNHQAVGDLAEDGHLISAADIQASLWMLLEGDTGDATGMRWSPAHLREILAGAEAFGDGYLPGCFGEVAIVAAPTDHRGPVTLFSVEYSDLSTWCGPEQVIREAWADGEVSPRGDAPPTLTWVCR